MYQARKTLSAPRQIVFGMGVILLGGFFFVFMGLFSDEGGQNGVGIIISVFGFILVALAIVELLITFPNLESGYIEMDERSIRYYNKSGLKDEVVFSPSVKVGVAWTSGQANREFGPLSSIFFISEGTMIDLGHFAGFSMKDIRRAWPYVVKLIRRHNLEVHPFLEEHLKCMRGPGRPYWNALYEELVTERRADRELGP